MMNEASMELLLMKLPWTTMAKTSGSLARCLIKKVMTTEEVSYPAIKAVITLSAISSSVSASPSSLAMFSRQEIRSEWVDILPFWSSNLFASTKFMILSCTILLALKLRLKRVKGRLMGTAHNPSIISSKSPTRSWRTGPSSRPNRSEQMRSNVKVFISGITCVANKKRTINQQDK